MTISYIFSQILVVLAYIFMTMTYLTKKRIFILIFNFGYLILSCISFLLLSAYLGLAMDFVAIVRNIILIIQNKDKNSKYTFVDYLILTFIVSISLVLSCLTYNGFYSLFSMFSTVLYSFSVWQRSVAWYKILGIPVSVLFIIYNAFIFSVFGIICESIFLVFVIIQNIVYFNGLKQKNNSI